MVYKQFKVIVMFKKMQFNRTNILIEDRSILCTKQLLFDFTYMIMMNMCQDYKLFKR